MRYIKEGYLRAVLQGGTQLTLNLINEIFKAEPKSSILIGIRCIKLLISFVQCLFLKNILF